MSLDIHDPAKRNSVSIGWGSGGVNGQIKFTGEGSSVHIASNCSASSIYFEIASNVVVHVGAHCGLGALIIHAAAHTSVSIGERTNFNSRVRLLLHEPGRIDIGSNCLIAAHTDLTISDMHSIIDAHSGARLNPAADIALADRVWIGEGALVLKGVRIGSDSVIGARAVVVSDVAANTVAAGNPARAIRSGVKWDFELK